MSKSTNSGYDFAGWATRNDIKCSDGRTIRDGAFAHCDGKRVPLVYQHDHDDINNVLGHVVLENVPKKGVRAYGYFNGTQSGQTAKEAVAHGDLSYLSVFANHLKQRHGDVLHGEIKEVSLVQAGANPGALIDVVMSHSDDNDTYDEAAFITTDESISLCDDELEHADDKPEDDKTEEKDKEMSGKTAQEIFDTMTKEQQNCCFFMMEEAIKLVKEEGDSEEETDDEEMKQSDEVTDVEEVDDDQKTNEEENAEMRKNVFENTGNEAMNEQESLCHSFMEDLDMNAIFVEAKSTNSTLSQKFLAHAEAYGITNLELLFPDYKNLTDMPEFIKRPDDWVSKVLNGVKHVPFTKIRTLFADITADEARAKGYTKGKKKIEEVFSLLKRETSPTTIYKKQKMDRDDIVDLANLNVIGWLRQEMRMMLDEEIARAILVSDGREALSEQKIKEDKVRPIIYDDELFTISIDTSGAPKDIIKDTIRSRKDYRGTGTPTFFTTEDNLTEMLLLEDKNERVIYDSVDKLKTALRCSDIVTVPVFDGVKSKDSDKELVAVIVNLNDYTVGADKGGAVNWFDDFDIDFNQEKYLIETRISGALTRPKSAIVLWKSATRGYSMASTGDASLKVDTKSSK